MSKSLNINAPQIVQTRNTLNAVPSGSTAEPDYTVKYVPQDLTEEQKAQARQNIGAAAAGETGGSTINEFVYTRTGNPGEYIGVISCEGYEPKEGDVMIISFTGPFYTEYNPVTLNNGTTNPTVTLLNAEVNATDYDEINPEVNTKWTVRLTKVNNAWVAINTSTQVQADWSTVDSTMPSYVKNKPAESLELTMTDEDGHIITGTFVLSSKSIVTDPATPLYIKNIGNVNDSITIQKSNSNAPSIEIESSTDNSTWSTVGTTSDSVPLTININAGEKVYLRCSTNGWGGNNDSANNTIKTGDYSTFKVGGNVMSLIYGSNFTGNETNFPTTQDRAFQGLFKDSATLVDAGDLVWPSTYVGRCGYRDMFRGCTSLVNIPDTLPATSLGNNAYVYMFYGCTLLNKAPILPATTLPEGAYQNMFQYCTSLTTAPQLPATNLGQGVYGAMFYGCTSLVNVPSTLPATSITHNREYTEMFRDCTSLVNAPILPIAKPTQYAYENMFRGCTSLKNITCLATDLSSSNAFNNWVNNVSATGTFTCASGMSQTWTTGVNGIPEGWTVNEQQ